MGDQNAADLISLPSGGGALSGLGETFGPDLHTGTGNYRVPIDLPAGRRGLQPTLALTYSTGSPNGPFGLGWTLDVPSVQRKTARGIPRYDGSDVFILSGAEDLVPVPGGTADQARYRPRSEGLFARIVHHTEPGDDYWEVWSKEGLRSLYGTPRPAGAPAGWQDPAVVADPASPGRALSWRLTQTSDALGNLVRYTWAPGAPGEAQRYLTEVGYVDYGDPASPGFLVGVKLVYEPRPDPFSDRRGGFEVRTSRRCTAIETWTGAGQPARSRTLHLEYVAAGAPGAPANGVSLLARAWVEGEDGTATQAMPPLELTYTAWRPEARRHQPLTGPGGPPDTSLGRPDMELIDLFGEGLPAIIRMNGVTRYWRNRGGGRLEPARPLAFAPPVGLGQPGVQLADFDGDGRPDLLVTDATGAGIYPLSTDGGFDPRGYVRLARAPTFSLTDPLVRLIDLDGDGVIDALRTGDSFELFTNDRHAGFVRVDVRRRGESVPDVSFDDPRVKLADMTGDGLTDIVLVHDRSLTYWPYLGYGRWGRPVAMTGAPAFADAGIEGAAGFDSRRLLLGDVDGDGCADVVYVGDGQVTVWVNRAGAGFAPPVVIRGTPSAARAGSVRLADMLGTGTAGVLWTYDLGTERESTYKFLDLTGGVKPYLLAGIDNHMGATTAIEYAPSTTYAIQDRLAGRPWRTTLPFPVQVVSRVTVTDQFAETTLVSELQYHHGCWDGGEREFRGFGRTDRRDARTPTAAPGEPGAGLPPVEVRTWFHVGPVGPELGAWGTLDLSDEHWPGDPVMLGPTDTSAIPATLPRRALRDVVRSLRGAVLRTEMYALDGGPLQDRPYTVTERQYGVAPILDGRAGDDPGWRAAPVVHRRELAQRTTQWDRGAEPLTQAAFTAGHDAYGRPHQRLDVAVPRGRDPRAAAAAGTPYLATGTLIDYATRDDDGRYFADHVIREEHVEIANDGSQAMLALRDQALAAGLAGDVRSLELSFYDGPAFVGLPWGQLGEWGLKVRGEQLALTAATLLAGYQGGDPAAPLPPYLPTPDGGTPAWPAEYPAAFAAAMPAGAGYVYAAEQGPHRAGWYVQTDRMRYDVQGTSGGRGLATARRDALGHDTVIAYDSYALFPVAVTDAAGLTRTAVHDYRVLRPSLVTDPNGNRTQVAYTPLGLPAWIAALGKAGAAEGDTPEQPGTTFDYGLTAWDASPPAARQPAWVRTTRRVDYRWQLVAAANASRRAAGQPPLTDAEIAAMFPPDEPARWPERFLVKQEFTDGLGRLLQTRAQAGPVVLDDLGLTADLAAAPGDAVAHLADPQAPPPVVVSGWQVTDDKGRVVERYEPFFDAGWDYARPAADRLASMARVVVEYDPRGVAVRTVDPDGSVRLVVPGVPTDLTDPGDYRPTPWERFEYDANDNAGRTAPQRSQSWSTHWNTPSSSVADALGRIVQRVDRTEAATLVAGAVYDVDGNLVQSTDALGRVVSTAVYDLLKRPWRHLLLDAGTTRTVYDAAGAIVERRDDRGALTLTASDSLGRPVRHWARDRAGEPVTLREITLFGDDAAGTGLAPADAAAANLLGRPYQAYDEAGMVTTARYDLAGNLLEHARRVLTTAALLSGLPRPGGSWAGAALRVDWTPPAGLTLAQHAATLLDPTGYAFSGAYDAAGRRTSLTCPVDAEGSRRLLRASYDRAGALTALTVDGATFVERILHDARGQRLLTVLGCGVMVRAVHDPATSRLTRLRSEAFTEATPLRWHPAGTGPLQDHGHAHDLVGNLLALFDRAPGCGVPATPDSLDRAFAYDPLYRLTSASGRECDVAPATPWAAGPRCADPTRAVAYTETYTYDGAGALTGLTHRSATAAATRAFATVPGSNRLLTMTASATTYGYAYDACGNMVAETTSRLFEWDHANRLATFRSQAAGADPSLWAQYRYDASGRRVLKLVRNQGGQLQVTAYLDGVFERLTLTDASGTSVHDRLNLTDGAGRLAVLRIGPPEPGDATPAVTYELCDHLGSSEVVVDAAGSLVNREEYTPFGETSFGSYASKRYRHTGKQRDTESGLTYHGARYVAPWLCRWISCDPSGHRHSANLYELVGSCPMRLVDPDGADPVNATDDVLQFLRNTAGFLAGQRNPPKLSGTEAQNLAAARANASPFGTAAHAEATRLTLQLRGDSPTTAALPRVPGIERIVPDPQISPGTNRIVGYGQGPRAGVDNPDVAVLEQGQAKFMNERVENVAQELADYKYGGGEISQTKYGRFGVALKTVADTVRQVRPATIGRTVVRAAGTAAKAGLTVLQVAGAFTGGCQVGTGLDQLMHGKTAQGIINAAEGGANLALTIGVAAAVKAGVVVAEVGAGAAAVTLAAGAAAATSVGIAFESVRAGVAGEQTPIDVMDKAYGTHFGDIYGWVTGQYRGR